jgi:hypothetical protein
MTPPPTDGPSLSTYVETRFNLVDEKIKSLYAQLREAIDERDRRYQERYESSQTALGKVADEMHSKFANVNEFRGAMEDAQRLFMPRAEAEALINGLESKLNQQFTQLDRLQSERQGIRGGWGYAVGVVGFVLVVISVMAFVLRGFGQ